MAKDSVATEERHGARREPEGKGIQKAPCSVHLFVLLAAVDHFVVQDFSSLRPLPTRVAAEHDGLTTARATPLSPRRRVHRSCALAGLKRHCGLRHYPRCTSASLRQAIHSFRPCEAHPEPPRNQPNPHEGAPTRARLARDSRQGEWLLFICCLWALFGPWGSVLNPPAF